MGLHSTIHLNPPHHRHPPPTTTDDRLEQSQKAADGAVAESRQQIEELQRQLGREQAALKGACSSWYGVSCVCGRGLPPLLVTQLPKTHSPRSPTKHPNPQTPKNTTQNSKPARRP